MVSGSSHQRSGLSCWKTDVARGAKNYDSCCCVKKIKLYLRINLLQLDDSFRIFSLRWTQFTSKTFLHHFSPPLTLFKGANNSAADCTFTHTQSDLLYNNAAACSIAHPWLFFLSTLSISCKWQKKKKSRHGTTIQCLPGWLGAAREALVPCVGSHLLCFLPSTRQEHSETQLLRKRARDLETEYKQLQLDCQGKDNRVLALEKEVEVTFVFH